MENAIQHGLNARATAGRIDVDTRRCGDSLAISITDDGRGVSGDPAGGRERFGLGNTRARLDALYGGHQRLELTNGPKGGALVSIELPLRSAPRVV